jgi:homoserine dehydrogenase
MSSGFDAAVKEPTGRRRAVGVGLYGCGNVGGGFVQVLRAREQDPMEEPVPLDLLHVVVRDVTKPRAAPLDPEVLTRDLEIPLEDENVEIVIEAMGGVEPATSVVERALRSGRSVATANKGLIARNGARFEALAAQYGGILRYEAAVAGAIPILHTLRASLLGNRIRRIRGIVNGTTNYILTRMGEDHLPYSEALVQAQRLGFAEADPLADVSGADAAQKLVILARHAFHRWPDLGAVSVQGIQGITMEDLSDARGRGCALKLVAEAEMESGNVRMRVAPALVSIDDPLYAVRNEMNAIVVEGEFSGPLLFSGAGAGGRPTGSAMFGDIVEIATLLAKRPLAAAAKHPRAAWA